jgi:hypothetical protein
MGETDKKPPLSEGKKKWGKKKKYSGYTAPKAEKFEGGKDELDGHHFDCSGYGQSDRFIKTVHKIADYVGQEYRGGGVARTEVITQTMVIISPARCPVATTVTAPNGLVTTSPPDAFDVSDYHSAKKIYDTQIQSQLESRQKIFSLVWQQCTEPMHAKIKAHREYKAIEVALNGIELLRIIKLICFDIEDEKYVPQKVHESKAAFYALKQGKDSDQAYLMKFINTLEIIEQCGASLGEDPLVRAMVCKDLKYQVDTADADEIAEISKKTRDYSLRAAFLLGADMDRYGSMIRGLKNASLAGRDEWPKNQTEAYNYISKTESEDPNGKTARHHQETSFVNDHEKKTKELDKEPQAWHAKMTCRNCNTKGHIASFCPDGKVEANVAYQYLSILAT